MRTKLKEDNSVKNYLMSTNHHKASGIKMSGKCSTNTLLTLDVEEID